ncbi:MAG: hypothetical protein WC047_00215 [Kiritimatiellales bacterium]
MKKSYEIWINNENESEGRLVDLSEAESMVSSFGDYPIYALDMQATREDVGDWNRRYSEYVGACRDEGERADITEFLDGNGIEYTAYSDEWHSPSGRIVFCDGEFLNEDDFDTELVLEWWDGSNWKYVYRPDLQEPGTDVIAVEYDENDEECLDEWDGSNFTSGSNGIHHYVVKLGDDKFLMIYRSQWQGSYTTAQFMTAAEYAAYRVERKLDAWLDA